MQLAENLRLLRECRFANLSTLESLEALGQLSAPQLASDAVGEDADPAPANAHGEHDGVDDSRAAQRAVLSALRLTQEQVATVLEVRKSRDSRAFLLKLFTPQARWMECFCSGWQPRSDVMAVAPLNQMQRQAACIGC